MNRTYGELSYNPKSLMLMYWGEGPNHFWQIANGNLIIQNILWACYNDALTGDEIALQIGVSLPYLEKDLQTLIDANLLVKNGNKYSTNIIIISQEYQNEVSNKIKDVQTKYADMVNEFIINIKPDVMNLDIDFKMSENTYKWQMATKLLYEIWTNFTDSHDVDQNMPTTAFGEKAFVWGSEKIGNSVGVCNVSNEYGKIQFFDYINNPKGDHKNFYSKQKKIDLYLDIALNNKTTFNNFEEELIVEMILQGYLVNNNGIIKSTMPIYTNEQINKLYEIFSPFYDDANKLINDNMEITYTVLKNHAPSQLKNQIKDIGYLTSYTYIFPDILQIMINNNYINTNWDANEMPSSYIIKK